MDEQQPVPSNGGVIAIAGGAAAVVAALVVGLGRSSKDAPTAVTLVVPDELKVTVRDAAAQAEAADRRSRELAAAVAEMVSAAREEGRAESRAVARESASLLSRIADLGVVPPVDVARARERAREALARGSEKGIEVTGRAKERAQRVGGQTAASTQSLAAQAATAAAATSERARELGSTLTEAARERAPLVRGRVEDGVVPPVRDAALQVASTASDLWQSARDRAAAFVAAPEPEPEKPAWRKAMERASFRHPAAPPPPKGRWQAVRERATHLDLETPAVRAAQVLGAGSNRARDASAAVADKASAIGGKVSAVGDKASALGGKAKDAPRKAVGATVHTGQDTAALLLWGGAATGLALYALMPPDVREQVLRAAGTVSTQVRELVRDFRGYDDEF